MLSACGGTGDEGSVNTTPPITTEPSPKVPVTYTLGGTVTGLAGGQSIDLAHGNEVLTRSANGPFTFITPVAQGGSYEVKLVGAQSAWQTCSVSNAKGSAVNVNVSSVAVHCVGADTVPTGQLNDTGIDGCSENISTPSTWVNNAVCTAINWGAYLWGQQQDAFSGRDAQAKAGTLAKVGSGMAGFDFTRIGASGKLLSKKDGVWSDSGTEAAGTQWDCVRDNVTGLVWEVKRNDATHLRHMGHGYAWYNPNANHNGGHAGYTTPLFDAAGKSVVAPTCTGVATLPLCNTQSYVEAVNAAGLCGKKDWRMPTVDELRSIVHLGRSQPAIDSSHFPNTPLDWTWSATPDVSLRANAWNVQWSDGRSHSTNNKNRAQRVRLVRAGP